MENKTYQYKRITVKIGSNVLTRRDGTLDINLILFIFFIFNEYPDPAAGLFPTGRAGNDYLRQQEPQMSPPWVLHPEALWPPTYLPTIRPLAVLDPMKAE